MTATDKGGASPPFKPKGRVLHPQCDCGRFLRYDGYYARWECPTCGRTYQPYRIVERAEARRAKR